MNFKEATRILGKPASMTDEECSSLPVWSDGTQCVSAWKAETKERLCILLTGRVWLSVLSGSTPPPVWVLGTQPFNKPTIKARISTFWGKVVEFIKAWWKCLINGSKQPDKRKHFIAGFVISLLVGVFAPIVGIFTAMIAGAVKEWWDSKGHGAVEVLDFIFACLGGLCAFPFSCIIHHLIF